jgi:PEGA domain
MPHCPHGRVYHYDVPLDCPECYREKWDREQAEEIAYETLEATRESVRTQNRILANLQTTKLEISSSPQGADVELDGAFVGNTPSTIGVSSGSHMLRIMKSGYGSWERRIVTSSGIVTISASLIPFDTTSKNVVEVPATVAPPQLEAGNKARPLEVGTEASTAAEAILTKTKEVSEQREQKQPPVQEVEQLEQRAAGTAEASRVSTKPADIPTTFDNERPRWKKYR